MGIQNGIKGTSLGIQGFEKGMVDGYKRIAAGLAPPGLP